MRTKYLFAAIAVLIGSDLALARGGKDSKLEWVSYTVYTKDKSMDECSKEKPPAQYMEVSDGSGIKYVISDEVKDKSGALISLVMHMNPEGNQARYIYFFKDMKKCEAEYKKAAAKIAGEKQADPKKDKYDSYK
jgi:hypothetical protein